MHSKGNPHGNRPVPLHLRFWTKVDKSGANGCWIWTAARSSHGYGKIGGPSRRILKAHRVAWELVHGSIPEGFLVCHHCDNPPCVNPDHLYLGTHKDNSRDMVVRGRAKRYQGPPPTGDRHGSRTMPHRVARGSRNGFSKLTERDAQWVWALRALGYQYAEIAAVFGVSTATVSRILRRKNWTHVDPPASRTLQ
jgi:hypothetical protein